MLGNKIQAREVGGQGTLRKSRALREVRVSRVIRWVSALST